MSNRQTFSNDRLIWILVRLLGVGFCCYAALELVGLAVVIGAMIQGFMQSQETLASVREMGGEIENSFWSSSLTAALWPILGSLLLSFLIPLALGIYALRGGGFFHRLLSYLPENYEDATAESDTSTPPSIPQTPAQQRQEVAQTIRQERAQREVTVDYATQQKMHFAQFAQQFPEKAALPPKERHQAFYQWQQEQA